VDLDSKINNGFGLKLSGGALTKQIKQKEVNKNGKNW